MLAPVCFLPGTLPDLFAQVSSSGKITLADRYGLMAVLLEESISAEDRELVDRILRAVRRRRLKVVDELSSVFTLQTLNLDTKIQALFLQCCA